jgi:transposase
MAMTGETLRLWLKQADVDDGKRSYDLTTDEQEELRRLRRKNRILREECEILIPQLSSWDRAMPSGS